MSGRNLFRFHPDSPDRYVDRKIMTHFELVSVEFSDGYVVALSPLEQGANAPTKAIMTHHEHPLYPAAYGFNLARAKQAMCGKIQRLKMINLADYVRSIQGVNYGLLSTDQVQGLLVD